MSHLIEKLPGSTGDKWPPTDVVVNIIAVLNNLVVESPIAARDIVYFDGLRKLFYIKKKRDRCELPRAPFPPAPTESTSGIQKSRLGNIFLGDLMDYHKKLAKVGGRNSVFSLSHCPISSFSFYR